MLYFLIENYFLFEAKVVKDLRLKTVPSCTSCTSFTSCTHETRHATSLHLSQHHHSAALRRNPQRLPFHHLCCPYRTVAQRDTQNVHARGQRG